MFIGFRQSIVSVSEATTDFARSLMGRVDETMIKPYRPRLGRH
jgi:hypothetical protein